MSVNKKLTIKNYEMSTKNSKAHVAIKVELPRFKNNSNATAFPPGHEVVKGVSSTVPGQAFSTAQLIQRITSGRPVTGRNPIFNGDEFHPDTSRMDTPELIDYLRQVKGRVDKHTLNQEKLKRAQAKAKADKDTQALIDKKVAEKLAETKP